MLKFFEEKAYKFMFRDVYDLNDSDFNDVMLQIDRFKIFAVISLNNLLSDNDNSEDKNVIVSTYSRITDSLEEDIK